MSKAESVLGEIYKNSRERFLEDRTILSFDQYLEDVIDHPSRHLRNCAKYVTDAVASFGHVAVEKPTGSYTRQRIFDEVGSRGPVVGQERVQENIMRLLMNFVRTGRVDRLIFLHGPNGSAKTSIIQAISAAAEKYSHTPQGVLYRFNWVFPAQGARRGGSLGFGQKATDPGKGSYAFLEGTQIESRIPCEFKDHPLFLLDEAQRRLVIEKAGVADSDVPDLIRRGSLSKKNRAIFDALMASHQGDVSEVLRHIQVERFFLSRRYRCGVVGVEPQMSVDAYARQVTADRSLGSLPVALQHLSLFQTGGALSDGNRGIVEFNDLLKRPLEAWKYLLVATEQAEASLDGVGLFLDVLMLASSNDIHLDALKEHPDWSSFKGRFELVTVPYLLRASEELAIYEAQVPPALSSTHIAPHALELAARWAVLTRLEPPDPDRYEESQRDLIRGLTPEEKLELYDSGQIPERLSQKERRVLKGLIPDIAAEHVDRLAYEGRFGASVREVRMTLLNAAQDPDFDHLNPFAVLKQLRTLVKEESSYPFLRRDEVRGYRGAARFVKSVEVSYRETVCDEVRLAMGLVEPDSHKTTFERYLQNVSSWTTGEKMVSVSGEPDETLMKSVEDVLIADGETSKEFRDALISLIGSAKLDRPDEDVDYELLFGSYMTRLEEDYYEKHKSEVESIARDFLSLLDGDTQSLDAKGKASAEMLRENLFAIGYNESSARHAVVYALKHW